MPVALLRPHRLRRLPDNTPMNRPPRSVDRLSPPSLRPVGVAFAAPLARALALSLSCAIAVTSTTAWAARGKNAAQPASASASAAAQAAPVLVIGPGENAPDFKEAPGPGARWPQELVGKWAAPADPKSGLMAGALTLTGDHRVTLAPEQSYVLKGFWHVAGTQLVFLTPMGEARMEFKSKPKGLELKYPTGASQLFRRVKD